MKKTVFLSLTPAIKKELDAGTITREEIQKWLQSDFQQYFELKAKMSGPYRGHGIHQLMDELLERLNDPANAETKKSISCRRGCSHCCYLEVNITWDEAALLIALAKNDTIKIDWEHLRQQLPGIPNIEYKKRACVFLKDGECSVYDARPNACRKYFVANDPDQCNSEKHPGGKTEVVYMKPVEMFASSMMSIQDSGTMAEMLFKVGAKLEKREY